MAAGRWQRRARVFLVGHLDRAALVRRDHVDATLLQDALVCVNCLGPERRADLIRLPWAKAAVAGGGFHGQSAMFQGMHRMHAMSQQQAARSAWQLSGAAAQLRTSSAIWIVITLPRENARGSSSIVIRPLIAHEFT